MANDEVLEMPWGAIFKRTAQGAAVIFAGLTGLCAAELRRLRREHEETERFRSRWTDESRWE